MAQQTKTDNHSLAAKLKLRRHFLDWYHAGEYFAVFDACQGSGRIWKVLAKEYEFAYWGVDSQRRPGRLKMDSERLLGMDGFVADVVDVDTYGSPWKHWLALLPNVGAPVTVFLTEGLVKVCGGVVDALVREGLGLSFPTLTPPNALVLNLPREMVWKTMIAQAREHGLRVRAIVEALNPGGSARYLGVRLEPAASETA